MKVYYGKGHTNPNSKRKVKPREQVKREEEELTMKKIFTQCKKLHIPLAGKTYSELCEELRSHCKEHKEYIPVCGR